MDKRAADSIAGYARAAEFRKRERKERLAKLTVEESRAIFAELVQNAESMPVPADERERLLRWRLETKIAVRMTFLRLARAQGLL